MSFACYVFSIGKNVSYISLGTGPFALGTPPFTGGADSVEKPLAIDEKVTLIPVRLDGIYYDSLSNVQEFIFFMFLSLLHLCLVY